MRTRGSSRLWLAALWLWLLGCSSSEQPTEVVIEIDADDSVRAQLDALHLEIRSANDALECTRESCWALRLSQRFEPDRLTWPVRFPVLPLNGDDTRVFEVIAQALDARGEVLIEQRAVSSFVPGASGKVRLALQDVCLGLSQTCGEKAAVCHGPLCSTCREGSCEPTGWWRPNEKGALVNTPLDAGLEPDADEVMDASGAEDDAGEDDAASADDASAPDTDAGTEAGATGGCGADSWDPDGAGPASCAPRSVCGAGQYVAEPGDTRKDRRCAGCASGSFNLGDNAPSCSLWKSCEAGSYVSNVPSASEDRVCAPCQDGSFTLTPNQSSCLPPNSCRAGSIQTAPGSGSALPTCEVCSGGEYCAGGSAPRVACGGANWDHDGDPATACSAKTSCVPGTFVSAAGNATTDRSCTACPASQFTAQANTGSCTAWTVCASGFQETVSPSATRDRTCVMTPWARQFGTTAFDAVLAVAADATGNVYAAGYTTSSTALPGTTNLGGPEGFVRKYNNAGVEQWTRMFGTANAEDCEAVVLDGSGNVLVVGSTTGAFSGFTSSGMQDVYVRKYNSAGTEQWTRQFGTTGQDFAEGVSADASGNVYVVGQTAGTLVGSSAGAQDAFVRKYDAAGNALWTRQFGTSVFDVAYDVAVDASGNVLVAGKTNGGTLPGQTKVGLEDAFLRKYDVAGTELWTRQFGNVTYTYGTGVAVDGSGNVFVSGLTYDSFAGAPGHTLAGFSDVFVRKYSAAGAVLWTRAFGSAGEDSSYGVAVNGTGDVFVSGTAAAMLPNQPLPGALKDGFVRKYSSAGAEVWTRQVGSPGDDEGRGVCVAGNGDIYLGGYTKGPWPGQTGAGADDAFVSKVIP